MNLAGVLGRLRRPRAARIATPEGWRELVTPEGVDLQLRVGGYGERFAAFALDTLILGGALIGVSIVMIIVFAFADVPAGGEILQVLWLLGAFLLRNGYFIWFESRPRAATPGKRAVGLRVAAADGGRLTAEAVFTRNALRELEVFLPLSFLGAQGQGVDAALIALGAIWSAIFVLFPLFNRDRRRLGDLVAGTMVIRAPQRLLQPDLSDAGAAAATDVAFTPAQLDAYGVKELHVLEAVLRAGNRRAMAEVAERIRTKIGWEGPTDLPDRTFLNAYYAGLRARLESQLLFGRRRKDKHDKV